MVDGAVDTLRQGVRDMRTLLVEIHPPRLESAGLEAVLDDLLSPLRAAGVETELTVAEEARADDALVYRVAREVLRNVLEHSEASHVSVTVTRTRLTVTDDGRGFDGAAVAGYGLDGMTVRATHLGADLAIRSRPGRGTTITLEVPT